MALDVDGNEIGEIGFFENSMRNQPDQFWRPEVVEAAYMDVASAYADNANVDITNVDQRAATDWDHNPVKIQEKYRRDKARREGLSMDDITNDDGTFQDGYTDEDLRAEYISEARGGVETLRKKQTQDPLFDPQRTTSGLTNLKEKITLNVEDEEFAGTIIAADYARGLNLEELRDADGNIVIPIEVAYVGANGVVTKRTIDPSNPAYQQLIQQMGESGINEMFDRAGYEIASAGDASATGATGADPSPQQIEIADLEQQRINILEGGGGTEGGLLDGGDGYNAIVARAEQVKQQAIDEAPEEVGFFGGLFGGESRSDIEARPLTDFMSVNDLAMYNNRKRQLAEVEAEIKRINGESAGAASTDNQTSQNPAAQPIQTETADAESRPLQTEPGGVYTSAQLEQNLESWEKELLAGTRPGQTVKSGVAVKAKNFGNLRPNTANPYRSGVYEVSPAEYDDDGNLVKPANQYQNFATYDDGLKGLIWDIKSKQHLDGLSSKQVADGAEIIEVMKKYAPPEDSNNPVGYTNHIVNFVNERLGLTGEEAFTPKSKASEFPTELLVEAIISKEDISLYKDMKERGYFEEDKISGIAGNVNSQTARDRRREISRA